MRSIEIESNRYYYYAHGGVLEMVRCVEKIEGYVRLALADGVIIDTREEDSIYPISGKYYKRYGKNK